MRRSAAAAASPPGTAAFAALALCAACCGVPAQAAVASYVELTSASLDNNPARGWVVPIDNAASILGASSPAAFTMNGREANIVRYLVALETYCAATDVSAKTAEVHSVLTHLRAHGKTAQVRLVYSTLSGAVNPCGHYYPDSMTLLESHVDAFAAVFNAFDDVVAVIEAGMLGPWGEWHCWGGGGCINSPLLTASANRQHIVNKLRAAYTAPVAVRRPVFKLESDSSAPAGSRQVGMHNDCFLTTWQAWEIDMYTFSSDYGGFTWGHTTALALWNYAATASVDVPVGGETCSSTSNRFACAAATVEMQSHGYDYLNGGYYQGAIDAWTAGGCLDDISTRLGYRFHLQSATHPASTPVSSMVTVTLSVANVGWGKSVRGNVMTLQLEAPGQTPLTVGVGLSAVAQTNTALKGYAAGAAAQDATFTFVAPAAAGTYRVFLKADDPASAAAAYAVRFASGTAAGALWQEAEGRHDLGFDIVVTAPPSVESYVELTSASLDNNPARGWVVPIDSAASILGASSPAAFTMNGREANIVRYLVALETYCAATDVSAKTAEVHSVLTHLRAHGKTAQVRLVYSTLSGAVNPCGHYYPDSMTLLESHVDAFAAVFNAFDDVVAVIEAGMLGPWGEWHCWGGGGCINSPLLTASANRQHIVNKLRAAYTAPVAVRRPVFKLESDSSAPAGSRQVGMHNDCFLTTWQAWEIDMYTFSSDYGGFTWGHTTALALWNYAATASVDVPVGGETCSSTSNRFACAAATVEMQSHGYDYLNGGYYQGAIDAWTAGGCLDDISTRLGYRFHLQSATHPASTPVSSMVTVTLSVANVGWGKSVRGNVMTLQLEAPGQTPLTVGVGLSAVAQTNTALKGYAAGAAAQDATFTFVAPAAAGTYRVFLKADDPASAAAAYAVRFASGTAAGALWQEAEGRHDLGFDIVVEGAGIPAPNNVPPAQPPAVVPPPQCAAAGEKCANLACCDGLTCSSHKKKRRRKCI